MALILLNKPFRTLCQFTDDSGRATLADWIETPGVYPAGRLDYDSEGLVALTDDGRLQARISEPSNKLARTYWVQVEGTPSADQLQRLCGGVVLKDGPAAAAHAAGINEPAALWPRTPPKDELAEGREDEEAEAAVDKAGEDGEALARFKCESKGSS
jgi:23S rRNA pseudouridine2457 synthase